MRGAGLRVLVGVAFVLAVLAGAPAAAGAELPPLTHLKPGQRADVRQQVPVTVVLVGLEAGDGPEGIDPERLVAGAPATTNVVDRQMRLIEQLATKPIPEKYESSRIGLRYDLEYRTVFADEAFEDAFFEFLPHVTAGYFDGGTIFQQIYSQNPLAAEHIDRSDVIDPVAAERWLASHAGPMLGVDTSRPTVFLVNWYGRPDFRFHTYGFLGQRPGFPYPIGYTPAGQMSAWGGTPAAPADYFPGPKSRSWFYDVSAGPDYWSANYLLDIGNIQGDEAVEDRIAPIWEYGTNHWFKPFDDLTGDLSKLVRYTAVDSLFAPSPVYDPAVSEPLLSDRIELDLNLFAGHSDRDPASTLRIGDIPGIFGRLDATRSYPVDSSTQPLTGRVGEAFDCQQTAPSTNPQSCFGNRVKVDPVPGFPEINSAFFDLDVFFKDHAKDYLDGTRYEVPIAFFDVPEARLHPFWGLLGLASAAPPNIQGWVYMWMTETNRLYGATDTGLLSHEVGHHVGLSHVHDAYDPLLDHEIAPDGDTFPMEAGKETYSTMSYIPNTDEFGQFDMDSMARWLVATRIDNANRVLGAVAKSGKSAKAAVAAGAADVEAGQALAALAAWNLESASAHAKRAYALTLQAAAAASVQVEPYSGDADNTRGKGPLEAATDPRNRFTRPLPRGALSTDVFQRSAK